MNEFLYRVYAASLYAYPKAFRVRFGREMQQVFRDRCRAAVEAHAFPQFLFMSIKDWFVTSLRERFAARQDAGARLGWRAIACHPAAIWMCAIFACLFASTTVVRAYVIPAASMEGSLRIGDHLLVDRLHFHAVDVHRGDMITFRYPEDARQTYVKRVIGLPGDRIRLSGKQVIRNGRRLIEPYAQHVDASLNEYRDNFPAEPGPEIAPGARDMLARNLTNGEVVVPADSFFVLGDNRDQSWDSRYWGFVPRESVVGKPWIVYWSYDATTKDMASWNWAHLTDLAGHFFTKTRWSRTMLVLRNQPAEEVAP
jgi:signal peptidase I